MRLSIRSIACWTAVLLASGAACADTATETPIDAAAMEVYGEDYPQYVEARKAHFAGQYQQAIDLYSELSSPLLKQSADCYVPACLVALGRVDEAAAAYRRLMEERYDEQRQDRHAYLGETLLDDARLRCMSAQDRVDFAEINNILQIALEWCDRVSHQHQNAAASIQDLGHRAPDFVTARTVINATTSEWYAPYYKTQVLLLKGYVLSQMEDATGAREMFDAAGKLSESHGGALLKDTDAVLRLQWEADDTSFLLPADAWTEFSEAHGPKLRLAFFYYLAGETAAARTMFEEVNRRVQDQSAQAMDWAAAHLGMGICRFRAGDENGAIEALSRYQSIFRQGTLAPLGRYILANIYAGNAKHYKDAIRIYGDVAKEYSESDYVPRALLAMAVCAANHGDHETALSAADRLADVSPNSKERLVAEFVADAVFGRAIDRSRGTAKARLKKGERMSRVDLDLCISLPGARSGEWAFSDYRDSDIVVITKSIGSFTSRITAVNIVPRLTVLEPQLPSEAAGQKTYFRSPLLVGEFSG